MQTLTSIFQILVWISRMKWDGMLGKIIRILMIIKMIIKTIMIILITTVLVTALS